MVPLIGNDPAARFTPSARGLGLRLSSHAEFPRAAQEIIGHPGAIAVAGVGFVGGQFDVIDCPVRFQLL